MTIADKVEDKLTEALNAEGRSARHVALGLLVALGAVGATAAIAAVKPQPAVPGGPRQPRASLGRAIWPALFSVTTLAAIRVWNAPSSPARTRALTFWGALQGVNALWMVLCPRDRVTQTVAALSTAGMTGLYAKAAADVDQKAASMVGPAGWASLGGAFTPRKIPSQPSVH